MIKGAKEKGLSLDKNVEVVNNKINEIDSKIRQLKKVRKLLSECIVDIEKGDC